MASFLKLLGVSNVKPVPSPVSDSRLEKTLHQVQQLSGSHVDTWSKDDVRAWLVVLGFDIISCDLVCSQVANGADLKKWNNEKTLIDTFLFVNLDSTLDEPVESPPVLTFGLTRLLWLCLVALQQNQYKFDVELHCKMAKQRLEATQGNKTKKKSVLFSSQGDTEDLNQVIRIKDFRTFSTALVVCFGKDVGMPDAFLQFLVNENINGEVFLSLTQEDLIRYAHLSKAVPAHAQTMIKVLAHIHDIKQNKFKYSGKKSMDSNSPSLPVLSLEQQLKIVRRKILESSKMAASLSDDELVEYAKNLGSVEGLKDAYLNKDFDAIKKLYMQVDATQHQQEKKTLKNMFASKSEQSMQNLTGLDNTLLVEHDDIEQIQKEHEREQENVLMQVKEKVKIKLVIAEIAKSNNERKLRQVLSPIMSGISIHPTFGFFHSALIIGPWYVEWNSSGLVVPRRCYSSAAILAVDIEQELSCLSLDHVIDKVSKVIVEWNVYKEYSQSKANCQHFIDALCEALGITLNFQGAMNDYITKLRNQGKCKVAYQLSDDIREKLEIKEKKIEFKTHQELDTFVNKILSKDPLFAERFEEDYMLLKSFDRAFWLRFFKTNPPVESFPLTGEEISSTDNTKLVKCLCPFGDPQASKSLLKDWW